MAQFETQVNALTPWTVLNHQLRSVGALCAKVSDTASAPTQVLSGLVDDFRERFATDFWGPLSASNEFSERLQAIQSELQALLYSYVRTFNREFEEVKTRFNLLLPSTQPPTFDVSIEGEGRYSSIHEFFQQLYRWIHEGFQATVIDCRCRRERGVQWRNSNCGRVSWNELDGQIEALLARKSKILDFETIQDLGTKIERMRLGFVAGDADEELVGLYDNPSHPPDFKRLADLFSKGQIQIHVERRTP